MPRGVTRESLPRAFQDAAHHADVDGAARRNRDQGSERILRLTDGPRPRSGMFGDKSPLHSEPRPGRPGGELGANACSRQLSDMDEQTMRSSTSSGAKVNGEFDGHGLTLSRGRLECPVFRDVFGGLLSGQLVFRASNKTSDVSGDSLRTAVGTVD